MVPDAAAALHAAIRMKDSIDDKVRRRSEQNPLRQMDKKAAGLWSSRSKVSLKGRVEAWWGAMKLDPHDAATTADLFRIYVEVRTTLMYDTYVRYLWTTFMSR
jgi:hypothetical protein